MAKEGGVTAFRYRMLVAEIIKSAAKDVLTLPKTNANHSTAVTFFDGEWFEGLAEYINLDADMFREKLFQKHQAIA